MDPDPDPNPDPDQSIILLSSSKNSKKNLDYNCFVTSFKLLCFKIDVNVPSKGNKQENGTFFSKISFCWRPEGP
jgi:hypothetical protein